jgi:hypothetical protein
VAQSKGVKMGGKINILNEKIDFVRLKIFKLLRHMKGNSINNGDF